MVISDLDGGGAQRVVVTLANAWARVGIRVCIITLADGDKDKYTLHADVTRLCLGQVGDSHSVPAALVANVRRVMALRTALRRAAAPTVISFIAITNILTILASLRLHVRLVISERNDPRRQPLGWPWEMMRRRLYRWADLITANSQGVVESLREFVPAGKISFLPNPVILPIVEQNQRSQGRVILSVGQLSYQKAHDVLLRAVAQIFREVPDWRLIIVGEGSCETSLKSLATALNISDRVEWVGWTSEVNRYYAQAEIFALPSRFEGTPNVLLEAMSFGLPPIVTDASPGPVEYIQDDHNGLVVPSENPDAFAAALRRLIGNQKLRCKFGAAARERVSASRVDAVIHIWNSVLQLSSSESARPST